MFLACGFHFGSLRCLQASVQESGVEPEGGVEPAGGVEPESGVEQFPRGDDWGEGMSQNSCKGK